MDPAIRGARREAILAAARAGNDLAELPDAVGEHGWPAARLARVVEYDVPDREGNGTGEVITLITTITDPADDRAVAYHERWEEETANDQLKTHLRGAPARCCAPGCPTSSTRRSGPTSSSTTRSAP